MSSSPSLQRGTFAFLLFLVLFLLGHVFWGRPSVRKLRGVPHKANSEIAANWPPLCGKDIDKAIINGPLPSIQWRENEKRMYYDVVFPPQCSPLWAESEWTPLRLEQFRQLDLLQSRMTHQIMNHWQHTLPPGIKPRYPEFNPMIFFHRRNSDPYDDLAKDGHLNGADGLEALWTVAITDDITDIDKIFQPGLPGEAFQANWQYFVVLKFKHYGQREQILKSSEINIGVARVADDGQHPDAYVFTKEAQKEGNSPLEIVRVYRYHLTRPVE